MSDLFTVQDTTSDVITRQLLQNLEGVESFAYEGTKSFTDAFGEALNAFMEVIKEWFGSQPEVIDAKEFNEGYAEKASEVMAEVFDQQTLEDWSRMTLEERAEKLDEFYVKMGAELGIDAKGVIIADLGEGTFGMSDGSGYIYVDYRILQDPEMLSEALNTTLHEARHQMQFDAIANPENFPDISPALIEAWERNIINYNTGAFDFEDYYNQAVEVDSRVFAADVIEAYINKMGL
ncbi:MAG: hypothetical protein FWH20_10270 [Oscillospiraceae bacterium]|nr:hypothetical protein [Oscillospiraceae bacterium]